MGQVALTLKFTAQVRGERQPDVSRKACTRIIMGNCKGWISNSAEGVCGLAHTFSSVVQTANPDQFLQAMDTTRQREECGGQCCAVLWGMCLITTSRISRRVIACAVSRADGPVEPYHRCFGD